MPSIYRIKRHSPKPKASRLIHLTGRCSRSIPRSPISAMTNSDGTTRTPPFGSCAAHRMPMTPHLHGVSLNSGCTILRREKARTRSCSTTCLRCSAVRRTDILPISGALSSKCGRIPSCMRISADVCAQGCRTFGESKTIAKIAELSPFLLSFAKKKQPVHVFSILHSRPQLCSFSIFPFFIQNLPLLHAAAGMADAAGKIRLRRDRRRSGCCVSFRGICRRFCEYNGKYRG